MTTTDPALQAEARRAMLAFLSNKRHKEKSYRTDGQSISSADSVLAPTWTVLITRTVSLGEHMPRIMLPSPLPWGDLHPLLVAYTEIATRLAGHPASEEEASEMFTRRQEAIASLVQDDPDAQPKYLRTQYRRNGRPVTFPLTLADPGETAVLDCYFAGKLIPAGTLMQHRWPA